MMYILWWSKPLDIIEPTVLRDDPLGFLARMWLAHKGKISDIRSIANPDHTRPGTIAGPKFVQPGTQIYSTGSTYGGLHALAWKAPSHTRTEQLLWQISTTAITGYGVAMRFAYWLINMNNRQIGFDLLKTFHYYFRKMKRFFGQLSSERISFPHTDAY
jgi:hypothetical protein